MKDEKDDGFIVLVIGTFFAFIIIAICIAIIKATTIEKAIEKAMENGYIQCIVDKQILWKKSCN